MMVTETETATSLIKELHEPSAQFVEFVSSDRDILFTSMPNGDSQVTNVTIIRKKPARTKSYHSFFFDFYLDNFPFPFIQYNSSKKEISVYSSQTNTENSDNLFDEIALPDRSRFDADTVFVWEEIVAPRKMDTNYKVTKAKTVNKIIECSDVIKSVQPIISKYGFRTSKDIIRMEKKNFKYNYFSVDMPDSYVKSNVHRTFFNEFSEIVGKCSIVDGVATQFRIVDDNGYGLEKVSSNIFRSSSAFVTFLRESSGRRVVLIEKVSSVGFY